MSSASVPVLYAGTTRLYPKPYASRPESSTKDQKGSSKVAGPFADLDRLLATSTAGLQQKTLPSYRWDHNASGSPVSTPQSVLIAEQSLVAIFFANRLQLFNTTTSTRNFEYVFESDDGNDKVRSTFGCSSCALRRPKGIFLPTTVIAQFLASAEHFRAQIAILSFSSLALWSIFVYPRTKITIEANTDLLKFPGICFVYFSSGLSLMSSSVLWMRKARNQRKLLRLTQSWYPY